MKKISEFLSVNFQFLEMKFSIYLNRRAFVMTVPKRYILISLRVSGVNKSSC